MPPTLPPPQEILGPPPHAPHAPHAPEVEDLLGPPPQPPRIGRKGHGSLRFNRGGHARVPKPGHVGRTVGQKPPAAAPAPARPQKIVIEQKPVKPVEFVKSSELSREYAPDDPAMNKHAGKPIHRAVRNASAIADKINPIRRHDREQSASDQQAQMSPEMRAKRAEQYRSMRATLDNMRSAPAEPNAPTEPDMPAQHSGGQP